MYFNVPVIELYQKLYYFSGDKWVYTNFENLQPGSFDQMCLRMNAEYGRQERFQWSDFKCDIKFPSVCQICKANMI